MIIISKRKPSTQPYLVLAFGILGLGFSAIFIRWADAPGTMTAFYRMAIGSTIMVIPFLQQNRQKKRLLPRRGLWLAVLGGVLFGMDLTLWTTGIVMSGATIPTLMANTAPLWVGLGSWLLFRERQSRQFWSGLMLALLGAGIVLGKDFSQGANFGMGGVLGLLAAGFYGAYYLVTQRARVYLSALTYFWITTSSTALLLLFVNLVFRHSFFGYDSFTYMIFLAVGVIVQVLGWQAINYAQGYIPASIVATTLLGQPVLTAIIAWPLFGETLTAWHFAGGLTVIAGVYLVHHSRNSENADSGLLKEKNAIT